MDGRDVRSYFAASTKTIKIKKKKKEYLSVKVNLISALIQLVEHVALAHVIAFITEQKTDSWL